MNLNKLFICVIMVLSIFNQCTTTLSTEVKVSEGISPLQAIFEIENDGKEGRIVAWNGADTIKSSYSNLDKVVLNGLAPNLSYSFIYETKEGLKNEEAKFTTNAINHSLYNYSIQGDTSFLKGHIFLKHYNQIGYHAIVNNNGRLVWIDDRPSKLLRAFQLTEDENYISLIDSVNVVVKDVEGKVVQSVDASIHGLKFHHDVLLDSNLIYAIAYDERINSNGLEITGDRIVAFNSESELVWEWSVFDERDINSIKEEELVNNEYGHANSLFIYGDNIFISFRDLNQIWKIDHKKNQVVWKFGKGGDFELTDSSDYFFKQHSAHINLRGDLMFYDNGDNEKRPHSRVLSFEIDEKNMLAKNKIKIDLSPNYSTYRMGSAYLINDSSVLVCASKKILNVGVFNLKGELKWELTSKNDSYRAFYLRNF